MRKWYMIHQIVNIIGYCIFRWPTIDFFQQWCYDLSPYTSPYTACFDNSPYGLWYGVDKRMVMDYNLILCGLMMNIWCSQVVKNVEWLPVGFRYPLIDETNQPRWTVEAFFCCEKISSTYWYTKNDMMIFIETDVGEILETPNLVPPGNLLQFANWKMAQSK